jgi:hypothetical protein
MFFPLHILLMAIATLGIITGVGAAIFFRKKSNWLKIHKSFNFFSLLGISAGIIMAVIYVSEAGGKHIDGLHQLIGLTAFILAAVTLSLGFYQFKAKNKSAVRTTHRFLGRISLVLILTAIMLGLKLINII